MRDSQLPSKTERVKFGYQAEEAAAQYLINNGYEILERRYKTKYGEVDIIAIKNHLLSFIEVKARTSGNFQDCISPTQIKRNLSAATFFLDQNPKYENFEMQYDLICIGENNAIVDHMKNVIFQDD